MNVAEAYYSTKNGKIKGILTLTEHLIMFDPIVCQENEEFVRKYIMNLFNNFLIEKYIIPVPSMYRHSGYHIYTNNQNRELI